MFLVLFTSALPDASERIVGAITIIFALLMWGIVIVDFVRGWRR